MVVANAELSRRYYSETALQILYGLLNCAEKGEFVNGDTAVCTLRAHIACILCHEGDLNMAREVTTPALQCSLTISDYAVTKAGWIHGWLLLLETQQSERCFPQISRKALRVFTVKYLHCFKMTNKCCCTPKSWYGMNV